MAEIAAHHPVSIQVALWKARQAGWTVVQGNLIEVAQELRNAADQSGGSKPVAQIVRPRKSDDDVQVLRPMTAEEARSRSLSAKYGNSRFPFHTDGAHLESPPDFLLLAAKNVGREAVQTHVVRFPVPHPAVQTAEDLRLGVFRVDAGTTGFYTVSQFADKLSESCIRFDPGCMNPIDPRSRRLTHSITSSEPDYSHSWTRTDEILIIDNHHVLHSRDDAAHAPDREILRLVLSDMSV